VIRRADDLERIVETQDGLDDLRGRVMTWFKCRRHLDKAGQYWTQLDALEQVLVPNLDRVQADVCVIAALEWTGEIRAGCRRNDRRVHLLDRYWHYFSEKWDQRDDEDAGRTLLAADEVVWSCWSGAFKAAGEPVAAAPLPYLEPFFTPRAIPRTSPPPDVQRADELLRPTLEKLPVPLIGLPPVVQTRPWWLAAIAHETGHHLQHDLAGGVLFSRLGEAVAAAVDANAEPGAWREWHEELFADACSVLLLGPAAATATAELLRSADATMLAEERRYPSACIRGLVMDAVLAAAGASGKRGVPEYRPDSPYAFRLDPAQEPLRNRAHGRRAAVAAVAKELVAQCIGKRALPALCGFDATRYGEKGEVAYWRDELLRKGDDPVPETESHTARTALAGSVAAWQRIAAIADRGARAEARERMAQRLGALLPLCKPGGKRAGIEVAEIETQGAEARLTQVLFGEEIAVEP
jgi:hypothetical protein